MRIYLFHILMIWVFCAYTNVCTVFNRSALKRQYQDRDQSSSPPSKQAHREDPQRGRLKNKQDLMMMTSVFILLLSSCAETVVPSRHLVLLYVRSGSEEVFDALMLSTPTLSGLREAVSKHSSTQVPPLFLKNKPTCLHMYGLIFPLSQG